jgi:hypothetical protein
MDLDGRSSFRTKWPRWALAGAAGLAVVAALGVPLPSSWRVPWWAKLSDLAHLPVFALLTWVVYRAVPWGWWPAVAAATMVAAACEAGQAVLGRSGNVADWVRGALGSLLAVVCGHAFAQPRTLPRVAGHLVLAAALVAWPVADALPALMDAVVAYRSFPVLCDFQTRWEVLRWYTENATLERVADPEAEARWAGRVEFLPGGRGFAGAVLFPVVRDWSGYRRLCCEFSVAGDPLALALSVRDGRKLPEPARRVHLERRYPAGRHRVCVDLPALARGEEFAPVDLARVESFHLVVSDLDRPRTVFVHGIRLEGRFEGSVAPGPARSASDGSAAPVAGAAGWFRAPRRAKDYLTRLASHSRSRVWPPKSDSILPLMVSPLTLPWYLVVNFCPSRSRVTWNDSVPSLYLASAMGVSSPPRPT